MDSKNIQDDLSHIRSMMERSSRFISLSGLSGVFAGLTALIGAMYVYFVFQKRMEFKNRKIYADIFPILIGKSNNYDNKN